jgi:hypothetical protein
MVSQVGKDLRDGRQQWKTLAPKWESEHKVSSCFIDLWLALRIKIL